MPSIYINEISPTTAALDFSATPSELASAETCYGFAYQKTLQHLGVKPEVDPLSPSWSRLIVEGSPETIKTSIPNLQKHIGIIARYGAERRYGYKHDRDWIGRILGTLVQHTLPEMPEEASFMRAMGIIVRPFADAAIPGHDILRIYYGNRAPTPKEQEEKKSPNPYSVRDIGGLLVGADGLPAQEAFNVTFSLGNEDSYELMLMQRVREPKTYWADDIVLSVDQDIKANRLPVLDTNAATEQKGKIRTTLPRELLEKLYDLCLKLDGRATMNDLLGHYIKAYVTKGAADPLVQEKVAAEKLRLQKSYPSQGQGRARK